jgi:hypothetical protein
MPAGHTAVAESNRGAAAIRQVANCNLARTTASNPHVDSMMVAYAILHSKVNAAETALDTQDGASMR